MRHLLRSSRRTCKSTYLNDFVLRRGLLYFRQLAHQESERSALDTLVAVEFEKRFWLCPKQIIQEVDCIKTERGDNPPQHRAKSQQRTDCAGKREVRLRFGAARSLSRAGFFGMSRKGSRASVDPEIWAIKVECNGQYFAVEIDPARSLIDFAKGMFLFECSRYSFSVRCSVAIEDTFEQYFRQHVSVIGLVDRGYIFWVAHGLTSSSPVSRHVGPDVRAQVHACS